MGANRGAGSGARVAGAGDRAHPVHYRTRNRAVVHPRSSDLVVVSPASRRKPWPAVCRRASAGGPSHATFHRDTATLVGALDDAHALPLGHGREHGKEATALWCAKVQGQEVDTRIVAPAWRTSLTICNPSHIDRGAIPLRQH